MPNLISTNLHFSLVREEKSQQLYLTTSGLTLVHQIVLNPQIFICIFEMETHVLWGTSQLLASLFPGDSSGCKAGRIGQMKALWLQQIPVLGST